MRRHIFPRSNTNKNYEDINDDNFNDDYNYDDDNVNNNYDDEDDDEHNGDDDDDNGDGSGDVITQQPWQIMTQTSVDHYKLKQQSD